MLAAAMCKLEGFSYAPSELLWWQQGHSSERDFIYVTTQTLGPEQLEALSHEVGADPNPPKLRISAISVKNKSRKHLTYRK